MLFLCKKIFKLVLAILLSIKKLKLHVCLYFFAILCCENCPLLNIQYVLLFQKIFFILFQKLTDFRGCKKLKILKIINPRYMFILWKNSYFLFCAKKMLTFLKFLRLLSSSMQLRCFRRITRLLQWRKTDYFHFL